DRAGLPPRDDGRRRRSVADTVTRRMLITGCSSRRGIVYVEHVDRALGGLDVVVNNAGYGLIGGIEQSGLDQAREQFETNYFGTLALVRRVLPSMRAQGSGHLLSVSSMFVPTLGLMGIEFQRTDG
ncbi:MAG TPA: SDR family NAD(P)-dependent oxidoreductase, partial [Acidimicrobiales bacterium]|nr:SDR family NAD(P)-dependent oxidoreductase [Acidimicrobiales bacterium]